MESKLSAMLHHFGNKIVPKLQDKVLLLALLQEYSFIQEIILTLVDVN